MLKNLKRTDQKGFTIIEVMIVLAIAGLILLIVLLAVPALQRNSRNTQIKNDAAAVAGGVSTFQSDNDGSTPNSISGTGTITLTDGSNNSTIKVQSNTTVNDLGTGAVPTGPSGLEAGQLYVKFGEACSTATGGSGVSSKRSFAIYYVIESSGVSGGKSLKCVDS